MGYDNRSFNGGNKRFEGKSETPQAIKVPTFYKDQKVDPELFDAQALAIAKTFIGKNGKGEAIGVTSTQLRKIFDEVKRFEQLLSVGEDQFEKQLPYIKMIKSKVAYSVARAAKNKPETEKLYENLRVFILSAIDLVKKEEDYHIFVSLFEAVYGFYYELAPKNCK